MKDRPFAAAPSPHPDDAPRGSVVLTPTATHLLLQLGEPRGERITFTRNRVELARAALPPRGERGARPAPTTGGWAPHGATASFRTDRLPDGPVHSSLEAVDALRRDDPGAAIRSAIDLVPGGGLLNDGLSLAADLLLGS